LKACTCSSIQAIDPKRHFKGCPARDDGYQAPMLVQLRLEQKVAESAVKWWKVEDWMKAHPVDFDTIHSDYCRALARFIVSLMKGK
jgi:hypothetical protein